MQQNSLKDGETNRTTHIVKRYAVKHRTRYRYTQPVSLSQHFLHLTPRSTPYQLVESSSIQVDPAPATWRDSADYFGNATTLISLDNDHLTAVIDGTSRLTVQARAPSRSLGSPGWEEIRADLAGRFDKDALFIRQFCFRSPCLSFGPGVQDLSERFFPEGKPVLEGALGLMDYIYTRFEYDSTATDVSTPVEDVLKIKRGVCQDFAHLQIACLRARGIPARYVSGYLLTHPPEGKERLQGADASHAWLSVYAGAAIGWVDLDPTNNIIPGDEHITLAWGRDYNDVSPIKGVTFGGGAHDVEVEVDVLPIGPRKGA